MSSEDKKPENDTSIMGRPKKEVDWRQLELVCKYKISLVDAANLFDMCDDTLNARIKEKYGETFSEYRAKKLAQTKVSLAEKAITMALNGDRTMLIFCLKNINEWVDKVEKDVQVTQRVETIEEYLDRKEKNERKEIEVKKDDYKISK